MTYAGVSLFYADDGYDWAKYMQTKLGSKEYAIHSVLNNIKDHPSSHTKSIYVNIFLLSPQFLDLKNWDFLKKFDPNSSLGILTGIDYSDLQKECSKKNCSEVFDWLIHELTGTDDNSVRDMMMTAVFAYETAMHDERSGERQQPVPRRSVSSIDHGTRTKGTERHRSIDTTPPYDFLPPKRQVNGFHTYVIKDQTVFVILHRVAEGKVCLQYDDGRLERADLGNPAYVYAFQPAPEDQGEPFHVMLDGRDIGHSEDIAKPSETVTPTVSAKDISKKLTDVNNSSATLPQPNTTTCRDTAVQTESNVSETNEKVNLKSGKLKNIRESSNLDEIKEKVNYVSGKDEDVHEKSKLDQINELIKDVMDPKELLCQCLGIEKDTRALDEKMKSMIKNVDALRHNSYPINYEPTEDTSSSKWPTLLHFGAQFNLLNFCDAFLSNPLMYGACLIRNKDNQCPEDIARQHGHTELSVLLTHFSNYVSTVGREGRYDSGFPNDTPRLSTITLYNRESQAEAPLPRPHNSSIVTVDVSRGYTRMSDARRESLEDLQTFRNSGRSNSSSRPSSRSSPNVTKQTRIASDDVGYVDEEGDADSETTPDELRLSGTAEETEEPFGPMYTYNLNMIGTGTPIGRRISEDSMASSKSSFYLDEENPEFQHSRKDIPNYLGAHVSPTEKKGLLSGFFKKMNRSRSASEPNVKPLPHRKSKEKFPARDSKRSSSTSSGSASSTTLQDSKGQEDSQIQMRDASAQKSKTKFKLFMSKAQRRRSVRIRNVMEDKNMSGPTLPPRRQQITETF